MLNISCWYVLMTKQKIEIINVGLTSLGLALHAYIRHTLTHKYMNIHIFKYIRVLKYTLL